MIKHKYINNDKIQVHQHKSKFTIILIYAIYIIDNMISILGATPINRK